MGSKIGHLELVSPGRVPVGWVSLTLTQLLECRLGTLPNYDIAVMNLVCALGLPGSEDMDIPLYLRRLDGMATQIRQSIERDVPKFRADPKGYLGEEAPESYFRMARLITMMKEDFGLHYNPERRQRDDRSFIGFQDSKDLLINGLLSDQRRGTCNSVPVVIVALARRLGYPLFLTATRYHVLARWDGGGERFNIDASCPGGFGDWGDDHYRRTPVAMSDTDKQSGYYLNNFTPADELALFLFSRAWVLQSNNRLEESLPFWCKCCHLAPKEPMYPVRACGVLHQIMHFKKHGTYPKLNENRCPIDSASYDPRDYFPPPQAAMAISILGHLHEVRQEMGNALVAYKDARELDPKCGDFQDDFDRYRQRVAEVGAEIQKAALQRVGHVVPTATVRQPINAGTQGSSLARLGGIMSQVRTQEFAAQGVRAMHAGRWFESQAAFVRSYSCAPEPEKNHLRAYLRSAICKELKNIEPVQPDHEGRKREATDDPRRKLSPELQARLWFFRGNVLESLQRFAEAVGAYAEALKRIPNDHEFFQHHQRATMLAASAWLKPPTLANCTFTVTCTGQTPSASN